MIVSNNQFEIMCSDWQLVKDSATEKLLWMGCVERVCHGITTIRERDGWRILKTHGDGCGVMSETWSEAVQAFAKTLL